jgi:hypothetical protein
LEGKRREDGQEKVTLQVQVGRSKGKGACKVRCNKVQELFKEQRVGKPTSGWKDVGKSYLSSRGSARVVSGSEGLRGKIYNK